MIVITGSIAYDYIMGYPGKFSSHILPEQLHNINLSFIVDRFVKQRGGTAGNVSYTLGLLQTPQTLFAYAGRDFEEYAKELQAIGVDTSHVLIDEKEYTATGFALSDSKQNQIWGFYYGASEKSPELKIKQVAKTGDLIYIGPQGAAGSLSLVKQCLALSLTYVFDPGFILTQITNEDLKLGLKHARYIIGNDYEIALMNSRLSDFAKIMSDKIMITTLGERGAFIDSEGKRIRIKPVKVTKVLATTGAGDAWRGGFFAGLERGFDLLTSGQMGSVAASYAVACFGTQEHRYTKREFTKRYQDAYNSNLSL
jgi:adenosine kinase